MNIWRRGVSMGAGRFWVLLLGLSSLWLAVACSGGEGAGPELNLGSDGSAPGDLGSGEDGDVLGAPDDGIAGDAAGDAADAQEVAGPVDPGCRIVAGRSWSPPHEAKVGCDCSATEPWCGAVYQGRVAGTEDLDVRLAFRRLDGEVPEVDRAFRVVRVDGRRGRCDEVGELSAVTSGTWPAGEESVEVTVPVWADEAAFREAAGGDGAHFAIVTGGGEEPSSFQWQPVGVRKVCEDGQGTEATTPFRLGLGEPIVWNVIGAKEWSLEEQVARLGELGPASLRFWFYAGHVSETPGVLDGEHVEAYTEAIEQVAAEGYEMLGMDHALVEWMTGVPGDTTVPCRDAAAGSDYQAFLDAYEAHWEGMAEGFPAIRRWQPGNELNNTFFLKPSTECDPDGEFSFDDQVAVASDMMYRASRGIREADPDATVVMPGLAPTTHDGEASIEAIGTFLGALYDHIASGSGPSTEPRDYFDVAAWNPYPVPGESDDDWAAANESVRQVMVEHGDGDAPVMFTSIGVTDTGDPAERVPQAERMADLLGIMEARFDWLDEVTWFRMLDDPTMPQGHVERGFGLLRPPDDDWRWKPTAFVFDAFRSGRVAPADTLAAFDFELPGDLLGFEAVGADVTVVGHWLRGTGGEDVWLRSPPVHLSPGARAEVVVRMAVDAGDTAELRLRSDEAGPRSGPELDLVADGRPHRYAFPLEQALSATMVTGFELRPSDASARFRIDSIRVRSLGP